MILLLEGSQLVVSVQGTVRKGELRLSMYRRPDRLRQIRPGDADPNIRLPYNLPNVRGYPECVHRRR